MHELPESDSATEPLADARPEELGESGLTPEEEAWFADDCYARHALEDGTFEQYRGYVIAVYQKQVVWKGKNPMHLRTRIAKKLNVHPLDLTLVDLDYGVL